MSETPSEQRFDTAVIGGGVVGCATAWHLLEAAPGMSVAVIEPDPTNRAAASSAASGGVRQLFTRPENVQLSQYTHEVINDWSAWGTAHPGAAEDATPELGWHPNGYLFIADPRHSAQLRADVEQQRDLGVDSIWLEPEQLQDRYPLLATDDLGPGVLSPRDGWLDPHAFRSGMRARARALGALETAARVVDFDVTGRRVRAARLDSGEVVRGDAFVNVAGVWGPGLSAQLGLDLPVEPMRRYDHYVDTPGDFAAYPFIKDPAGLAVRPEGPGLTAALVDFSHPGGFDLGIDRSYFEDAVWPALVQRFPATAPLRLRSAWAGLYDQNRLDGNMIIDRWAGHLENYYVATGFSGHGLMHAPGVGRALTELVLHAAYRTIDLTRMGLDRVRTNQPYAELAVR